MKRNAFRSERIDDGTGMEIDSFAGSTFMGTELAKMESNRDAARMKRLTLFWTPTRGCRCRIWKCRTTAAAIDAIAAAASKLNGELQLLYVEHNSYTQQIDDHLQDYADQDALHYTRLYMNRNRKNTQKIFVKLKRVYRMLIALLNKALEILRGSQNAAQWYQTKCFLRIRYYYQCASSKDPKLPVQYLGDDRLMAIANTSPMYPYEKLMRELEEKIDALTLDLRQLSQ